MLGVDMSQIGQDAFIRKLSSFSSVKSNLPFVFKCDALATLR